MQRCLFLLMIVLTIVPMSGCSTVPQLAVRETAEKLRLIDRVDIRQQRLVKLSRFNNIGWRLRESPDNSVSQDAIKQISSSLELGLIEVFDKVIPLEDKAFSNIDFVIEAQVIEATGERDETATFPSPHRTLIKLSLFDARTRQLLNVAWVNARSGAIDHSDYPAFLRTTLRHYSHQLVDG